ncbi:hypothetical protein DICSQDRAFT_105708 [Dichomitus squalens LYAD-421 SS1]|uniref:Uncharacterized protein n=2 Tax=Dichomitus squalens TaxID=114155 RepID=A0A4Q9MKR4_9APHY|nr:uncharacterized protein DICSQDRAFT_105708 [Dichomitus squalens LYAD-421 SS1]EJF61568.1 hypothetical protein DICSQDRAFT_105708 [Dichomitus squalens LYAD-421 SS1]TBU28174.1 hypothetical protein BD311DRAFT_758942 [Dichomitus squalens]
MGNSLEDWKRTPTTTAVLFGIDLPYRPPKNAVGAFLWRQRLWIETTCGLSLLEPWEKILTLAILYLTLTVVFTGLYTFLPQELPLLYRRTLYYFLGNEESEAAALSVRRLVGGWVARNASVGEL